MLKAVLHQPVIWKDSQNLMEGFTDFISKRKTHRTKTVYDRPLLLKSPYHYGGGHIATSYSLPTLIYPCAGLLGAIVYNVSK